MMRMAFFNPHVAGFAANGIGRGVKWGEWGNAFPRLLLNSVSQLQNNLGHIAVVA